MPKRQRWTPVRGQANRIYDRRERFLVGVLDLPGRCGATLLKGIGLRRTPAIETTAIREVLVLRLDRIGDVLMSLPALFALRSALPSARIRLVVGRWSEAIAQSAPVDEIVVWNAPWVGRPGEGAESWGSLARRASAFRASRLDLALDLQGDLRSNLLMWLTGARIRIGYANTGAAYLLTHVVPLDETVSWVEQNRRAVAVGVGGANAPAAFDPLTESDRDFARRLFALLGLERRRPLVGVHPSGGRPVKQWPVARFREVARRLEADFGATVLVTGTEADGEMAAAIAAGLRQRPFDLTGRLSVRETLAVISGLDLFLSPDTGPMHMACATDTPCVAVFGPSDPARYFSGGNGGFHPAGGRQVVVRSDLWCSPCNLIRKPPLECSGPEAPECLQLVTVEAVYQAAVQQLRQNPSSGEMTGIRNGSRGKIEP